MAAAPEKVSFSRLTELQASEEPAPLHKEWSFWFYQPSSGSDAYDQQVQKLDTFNTVRDFWDCYKHLPRVDTLQHKHSFHLMKRRVKPEWEDAENQEGGEWTFKADKSVAQDVWQRLLLCCIGEQFDKASNTQGTEEICGVTVKGGVQSQYVFQIWHRDAGQKDQVLAAAQELMADVPGGKEFKSKFYKSHKEELQKAA